MEHLRLKYIPNNQEQRQLDLWIEKRKENPNISQPDLPVKIRLFSFMHAILVEDDEEVDEEMKTEDKENEGEESAKNITSTKVSKISRFNRAQRRSVAFLFHMIPSTTYFAMRKFLVTLQVWFMQHTILIDRSDAKGRLAILELLLQCRTRLFCLAEHILTGEHQTWGEVSNSGEREIARTESNESLANASSNDEEEHNTMELLRSLVSAAVSWKTCHEMTLPSRNSSHPSSSSEIASLSPIRINSPLFGINVQLVAAIEMLAKSYDTDKESESDDRGEDRVSTTVEGSVSLFEESVVHNVQRSRHWWKDIGLTELLSLPKVLQERFYEKRKKKRKEKEVT